jgi:hypothetical protein
VSGPVTRAPLWFVASVAVAAIALIAGVGVIWTANGSLSDRDDSEDTRAEIIEVAEQYFLASQNYDFTDVEGYRERVHPLMTERNREEFDKTLSRIDDGFAKIEAHAVAQVREAAVEVMDEDSPTVMVTGDVEFDSTEITSTSHPRWEVMLRLVDGEWLVDEHTELGDDRIFTAPEPAGGQ